MHRIVVSLIRLIALVFLVYQGATLLNQSVWVLVNELEGSNFRNFWGYYAVIGALAWLAAFSVLWLAAPWLAKHAVPDKREVTVEPLVAETGQLAALLFVGLGAYWVGDAIILAGQVSAHFMILPADALETSNSREYRLEIWRAVLELLLGIEMILGSSGLARIVAMARRWQ